MYDFSPSAVFSISCGLSIGVGLVCWFRGPCVQTLVLSRYSFPLLTQVDPQLAKDPAQSESMRFLDCDLVLLEIKGKKWLRGFIRCSESLQKSRLTLESSWKTGHSSSHPLLSQTNAICLFTMHSGSLLCGWPSILKRCQNTWDLVFLSVHCYSHI